MKISTLRLLILMGLFKMTLCTYFGINYYVKERMTWSDARKYCREKYTDLSSIGNQYEEELFINYISSLPWVQTDTWIGLYQDDSDNWKWSGGTNASFFNWDPQDPIDPNNRCVVENQAGWHKKNCEDKFVFFCFQSHLVLVKENKTWEEALEHCRIKGMELFSLRSYSDLIQVMATSRTAETNNMWTSLRYLAGNWLWVDRILAEHQAKNQNQMPQCPTWTHRCGALSLDEQHLVSWDCADRLNFVCYNGA